MILIITNHQDFKPIITPKHHFLFQTEFERDCHILFEWPPETLPYFGFPLSQFVFFVPLSLNQSIYRRE